MPVYLSGMARGLLGRDSPLQMRHARRKALREADCVLLAGVPCDFRLDYGKHVRRSATLIAANRSTKDARLNRTADIEAIGDAGRFLVALAHKAHGIAASRVDRDAVGARRRAGGGDRRAGRGLGRAREPGGVLPGDGAARRATTPCSSRTAAISSATASYILHPRGPLTWLDPGAFGTLGVGAGFALGAAVVRPDPRKCGSSGATARAATGSSEFDTFVRHGIPVIAVVGNDAAWTQIAREQVKMLGDDVGTVLARTAYHEVARGFGAEGVEIRTDAEVEAGLARGAAARAPRARPVLVNVWLDKTEFREGSISM